MMLGKSTKHTVDPESSTFNVSTAESGSIGAGIAAVSQKMKVDKKRR